MKKEKVLSALIAFQLVAGQGTWMCPVVHAEDAPAEGFVVHEGDKKGSVVVGGDAERKFSSDDDGVEVADDKKNTATGVSSVVVGGSDNHAKGDNSVIVGGTDSTVIGSNSVVGLGGKTTGGGYDFVFGKGNASIGDFSTILGGLDNAISAEYDGKEVEDGDGYFNQIFGGHRNLIAAGKWRGWGDTVSGYQMGHNTIINGMENKILNWADLSAIIGGKENTIDSRDATNTSASIILGGEKNTVNTSEGGYILGGVNGSVTGNHSAIVGGENNSVSNEDAAIISGYNNAITGDASSNAILGGSKNTINNDYLRGYPESSGQNAIVGGYENTIDGNFGGAGIFGGVNNKIAADGHLTTDGNGSSIIGGRNNTVNTIFGSYIFGGEENTNTGKQSAIIAGESNSIENGNSAIVSGNNNKITGDGYRNVIIGGGKNTINNDSHMVYPQASGQNAILGGYGNTIDGDFGGAGIIGGLNNKISASSWRPDGEGISMIVGGKENTITSFGSYIFGGQSNTNSGTNAAIVGGHDSTASGETSAIVGGESNTATGIHAFVGGGTGNKAIANNTSVFGSTNTASANRAFVGGGYQNSATGTSSATLGGESVLASGSNAVVLGGEGSRSGSDEDGWAYTTEASGDNSAIIGGLNQKTEGDDSAIVGGSGNATGGDESFIGGGTGNLASGSNSAIIGGKSQTASGYNSSVLGGRHNTVDGDDSAVVAGRGNTNKGTLSVILGGGNEEDDDKEGNEISEESERSVIAGGKSNSVYGDDDLVSGESNTVSGDANLVGGSRNKATSSYGFVSGRYNSVGGYGAAAIGGYSNTVNGSYAANIGGYRNQASGAYSVTLGGQGSTASGDNSLASQGGIAYGANSIALGSGSVAYGSDAVAIGTNSINNEAETVSFGRKATDKTYNLEQKWTPYRSKSYTSSDGSYGYSYENYTLRDSDGNAVELSTDGSLQLFKAGNYTLTYDYSSWHIDPATGEKVIDYSNQSTAGGITLGKDMYGSTSLTDNGSGVLQTTNFYTVDESAPTTAITRRLTNVSRGVDDTDAVNVSQLKDAINEAKFDPATGGDDPLNVKYDSLQKTSVTLGGDTGTQIKNVAEGTDGTDAVNLNQLNKAIANINISGGGGNDKNAVHYDGDDHTKVSLTGEGGTTITNVKDGEISDDSTDAINGSQLKAEQDERKDADDKLDKRIGTLDVKTYNYIDASNNVSQNLQALDEAITNGGGDCLVKDNGKTITIAKDSKTSVIDIRGSNQNRVITGVQTNPADGSSAVSVDYLNGRVNDVNNRIDGLEDDMKGIGAGAAALAGLHPLPYDPNNRVSYATSIGSYEGKTAFALGAFYQAKRDLLFSIGGAFSNGTMMNLGVAGRFGKTTEEAYGNGGAGGAGSGGLSPELAAEIQKLRAENASMRAENQKLREENEYVSKKSNWFLGVAHDMYEKMRTMTGREEDWEFVKKDKEKGMDSVK